ncbi:MAG: InlB B-repeat-containing protein [Atopobiaceae bacterium]|nr:InlB B-repeat-containing protein [Atopobiaceae bacterium]
MKRLTYVVVLLMSLVLLFDWTAALKPALAADSGDTQQMHRLYNPNSGEHFYTARTAERDMLVGVGWKYEGIGWIAPAKSNNPVYRLYNKNAGDHHYTMNKAEKDMLVGVGWNYEGIGWYSSETKAVPLYRQYNPNARAGSHNYTTNKAENDMLVSVGWRAEGIGWYGANTSAKPAVPQTYTVTFKDGVDGKTLKTETVQSGQSATAPSAPEHTGYTFSGWDKDFSKITSNLTIMAIYTKRNPDNNALPELSV